MSDETRVHSQNTQAETTASSDQVSRRRRRIALAALLILMAICVWQVVANYDFWEAAWTRGALFAPPPAEQRQRPVRKIEQGDFTVPREQVFRGGVPKDGIPALTDPKHIAAREADFLKPDDRVIGVESGSVARAYPLAILNYHEIVNDRVGELPLAVTYCPLCDSVAVFDRRTKLGERDFGVSGLLYNSNVLMYDRGGKPESLWSQIKAEGVSGPGGNVPLKALPVELTTWKDWLERHPKTTVLSVDTGHARDYGRNPYAGYFESDTLMFPVEPLDERLPKKTKVLGVWTAGGTRAYPLSAFSGEAKQLDERLGDETYTILFDPESGSLRVTNASDGVQWMYAFWFAWAAFRPDTEIFQ